MPDTPMYDYGYYSNYNNGGNTQGIGGQYPGNYGYYPQGQGQFGGGMSNPQYGSMANYFQSPQYQQYQQNYNTQNQGVYDQWVNYTRQDRWVVRLAKTGKLLPTIRIETTGTLEPPAGSTLLQL